MSPTLTERERGDQGPLIGIWWDDGIVLTVFTSPPEEGSIQYEWIDADQAHCEWIDTDLEHADEWPRVARWYGRTTEEEYFEVPRGRVLIHKKTGKARIFHGDATDEKRIEVIAEEFRLTDWEACQDEHYNMEYNDFDD